MGIKFCGNSGSGSPKLKLICFYDISGIRHSDNELGTMYASVNGICAFLTWNELKLFLRGISVSLFD